MWKLLKEDKVKEIHLSAVGNSIGDLIIAVEILKSSNPGLFQQNIFSTIGPRAPKNQSPEKEKDKDKEKREWKASKIISSSWSCYFLWENRIAWSSQDFRRRKENPHWNIRQAKNCL